MYVNDQFWIMVGKSIIPAPPRTHLLLNTTGLLKSCRTSRGGGENKKSLKTCEDCCKNNLQGDPNSVSLSAFPAVDLRGAFREGTCLLVPFCNNLAKLVLSEESDPEVNWLSKIGLPRGRRVVDLCCSVNRSFGCDSFEDRPTRVRPGYSYNNFNEEKINSNGSNHNHKRTFFNFSSEDTWGRPWSLNPHTLLT